MLELLIFVLACLVSAVGVGYIRRFAIAQQMLDMPNERSLHKIPTPSGGGVVIVVVVLTGVVLLYFAGVIEWQLMIPLLAGGGIAYIGYIDDKHDLSPGLRAIVHFGISAFALLLLNGLPPIMIGTTSHNLGWFGNILGLVGFVWMINLYNFMDGIDGLAASEAVFIFLASGVLLGFSGFIDFLWLMLLFSGACVGFLYWNWTPAKIFMGDVGSGFLGYVIAVLAIASGHKGGTLWVWLILVTVFSLDTTITLIRRILRGEKWYRPHRSHAYQHATLELGSHSNVTIVILLINLLWLFPLAIITHFWPSLTLFTVPTAIVPISILVWRYNAGLPDSQVHMDK